MRRLAAIAALTLILAGCGKMFGLRRGDLPEPPPEGYAQLGIRPGYTLIRLGDDAAVNAYCRANGVGVNGEWTNPITFNACIVPQKNQVVLPAVGTHDATWDNAIIAHEGAHTWGLVHGGNGARGWVDLTGHAPPEVTPEMAKVMLQVAQAQAASKNIFAQQPTPPQGGGNPFAGR